MDVLKELENSGAVIRDQHFVYVSGKHGSGYVNADNIFPNIELVATLCDMLIEPFVGEVDTVVSPAVGGVVVGTLATKALIDRGQKVHGVWADKTEDREFVFERAGFVEHIPNKRVLIVEDFVNVGSSVEKVSRLVEKHGGNIVGISVIGDRGNVTADDLKISQLRSLVTVKLEAIEAEACELCASGVPIVENIGHGGKYKAEHPDYSGGYINL